MSLYQPRHTSQGSQGTGTQESLASALPTLQVIKIYNRKWWLVLMHELFVFGPTFLLQNSSAVVADHKLALVGHGQWVACCP